MQKCFTPQQAIEEYICEEMSKVEIYEMVREHTRAAMGSYLCNMAKEMGLKIGERIENWINEIHREDPKAIKAWCSAVEYIPNLLSGSSLSLERLIMEDFKEKKGLIEETESMSQSWKKGGGSTQVTYPNLSTACHAALIEVRRAWKRKMKKSGKLCIMITRPKGVDKSRERLPWEFFLQRDGKEEGRVSPEVNIMLS